MFRTCFAIGFCTLLSALPATELSAQDAASSIVFTGCPPFVDGSHCDSLFYQVVAVDLDAGSQRPGIVKYILVSGPGTVNERTGLWVLHPERDSIPSNYSNEVEIAAYKGNDTTTSDENCRFAVNVLDQRPYFGGYCGAHITIMPGDTITIPIEISDTDPCDDPRISSVTIQPEPSGFFAFDTTSWKVRFEPDAADEGISFEVRVAVSSGMAFVVCSFWFDVFQPEPTKFRIATVETTDTQPGDTVRVDIILDESAVAFDRVVLTVGFDNARLQLVDVDRGQEFFSEETGCGWDRFNWFGPSYCGYGGPGVVRLMAWALASSGSPEPPCLIPGNLPATFATMKFVVMDRIMPGEYFAPISFFWCNCGDNYLMSTLPRPRTYLTYLPSAVYSPEGQLIPPDTIPGYSGASDECYYYYQFGGIERYQLVEYYNGGVNITVTQPEATYSVRIGHQEEVYQGQFHDVPITLEKFDHTQGLGGFDVLIAYDASALSFQRARKGALYDSCGWEYFTYRYGSYGNCDGPCPSGLLRVVGMAETNNGGLHPSQSCEVDNPGWVSSVPVTLATIQFLVSNDRTLECQFVPIRFFWYECGDNVLSNRIGSEVYLSSFVYDFDGGLITSKAEYPTYFGAQDTCVIDDPYGWRRALRAVDYFNGGLDIICGGPIDDRGDINCNGLSFEIADVVMFSNYFLVGLGAFGSHIEFSIAASDVNYDGIALTVEDFVFVERVIAGDALPFDQLTPSPNPATFIWDTQTSTVGVSSLDSLGAVYLIVESEITPALLADHMQMKFGWDTGWTKILVYSLEAGRAITSGEFVRIPGATGIVSVEAATYDARAVTEIISDITDVDDDSSNLPLQFALHANYPNPFNPETTIGYGLPEQARVRITVYNMVGQVVRTLVDRHESPGQHETIWDGRDDSGRPVSSGLYLYRMTAGDFTQSRKMLLLK